MSSIERTTVGVVAVLSLVTPISAAAAAPEGGPTSSLLARAIRSTPAQQTGEPRHLFQYGSLFAVAPPEERVFQRHDLVQIIVRESSRAESSQELDTQKDYRLDGAISAWPDLNLSDLLQLQVNAGRTANLPAVGVDFRKDFNGDGDYARKDDLTARLTAEVIEVLPNGNLVLEARTEIAVDEERSVMKVTGVCRPDDVTAANTIVSTQLHDLKIAKAHEGELKRNASKGILSRIFDAIFAF